MTLYASFSGWYVEKYNDFLEPLFNRAVDMKLLIRNPCKGCIKIFYRDDERDREALTKQEQSSLEGFVDESRCYARYRPLVRFLLGSGLRCGELMGLAKIEN